MDQRFCRQLEQLRAQIESLAHDPENLGRAAEQAGRLLEELRSRRDQLMVLNQRLATVSAESAELVVDLEEKNLALAETNAELARANAHAAELMGEIEIKNHRISILNDALSKSNAMASELLAELELKKADLEQANTRLETANDEKSRLLGVVAHDMRSGIGGIHGLAKLLCMDLEGQQSEVLEHLQLIETESGHMLELLASLLDVTSLDQGRLELHSERCDFNHLVRQVTDYYRNFAGRKDQTLVLEPAGGLKDVLMDPVRIRQACDNLISNAIKYSQQGAAIRVSTWQDPGGSVGFSVVDGGPGLSAQDLAGLFKPFQKLTPQPTGGEDSHGLGLAITKQLIDLHEGKVWAENLPEGGCRFSFTLPAKPAGEAAR